MTLAALAAMLWSLPAAAQEEYRQPALEKTKARHHGNNKA